MSAEEITISDRPLNFKFSKAKLEGAIKLEVTSVDEVLACAVIDRNQLHLLMLYLQEHLK